MALDWVREGWVEYCWVGGIVYCGIWYKVGTFGAGVG